MLADDCLSFVEQVVADLNRLIQKAARITAQVQNQPLHVAEAVDGRVDFLGGGLLELLQVNVADAGANLIFQIDAGIGNLIPYQVEDQWVGVPSRFMLT